MDGIGGQKPPEHRRALPTPVEEIQVDERTWRPKTLDEFIGQSAIKQTLGLMLNSAKTRRAILEHIVFWGPPGLGKTTLAAIIASEMGGALRELAAPSLQKAGDLVAVLAAMHKGDVLFLDEIHALRRELAEMLYSGMEDFRVAISKDGGEPITLSLSRFTLVGATTDYGLLPEPLRARFGSDFQLDLYTADELEQVVARAAEKEGVLIDSASLEAISRRSRGTPRVALRLFRRCYDLAVVRDADLTIDVTNEALSLLKIDPLGLDAADQQYLHTLVEIYSGGPVGTKALAASAGLNQVTLEQAIEPWLVRSGLVARTRRGRRITRKGFEHISPTLASTAAFDPEEELDDEDD